MKENKIQSESFQWFHNNYCLKHHSPCCVMFSVPNEFGNMVSGALKKVGVNSVVSKKTVSIITSLLKAMGLTSGVSDTVVLMPNKILFIEFKNDVGIQSKEQKAFQSKVEVLGFRYAIVRSFADFQEIIKKEIG